MPYPVHGYPLLIKFKEYVGVEIVPFVFIAIFFIFAGNLKNFNYENIFPVMGNALDDDVSIISKEQKEYLKNLPPQKELEIEGTKILMVHGSPRRNNEDILPETSLEELEKMLIGVNADLIFCGHTHVPCGFQTNSKKTVVNVGSVGRPMTKNPQSCYVIADFNNGEYTIEQRLIDYDRETASQIMKKRGFAGAEKLAEMILHPKDRHV